MEVLRLENLSKYYTSDNSVVVGLSGINLSFSTGEFVALTGESGSGKSTLAHVLSGILPYESGELYIYGQPTSHYDANDRSKYRRDLISFISQSYGILPGNTVAENIESALRLSGLSVEEARARAEAILEEVELTEFKKRKAGKLSSGQKQRLSIARALAKPSKILIADEPTGNLDRENSEKVISLLKRASRDRLVILITHEFEEAKDVATRRIILSDGAVVTDAKLSPEITQHDEAAVNEKESDKKKKRRPLVPYVCRLTIKSRPIFTAILSLLLAITTFITFVFLGTFIVALDDASTRIYDTEAFYNGDPERIIVMRTDGGALTKEDYNELISLKHAVSVEHYGDVNDFIYHYKKDVDHREYEQLVFGPNYNKETNPYDFSIQTKIELYDENYLFVKTLPQTAADPIKEGRAPKGFYEVVSADPEYKVGDKLPIYIRNKNLWSESSYIKLNVTVVGTTDIGEGIYFSDGVAASIRATKSIYSAYISHMPIPFSFMFVPYDESNFTPKEVYPGGTEIGSYTFGEDDLMFPSGRIMGDVELGTKIGIPDLEGNIIYVRCTSKYEPTHTNLAIVSQSVFDKITDLSSNQASLYIKDYAYSERVIDELEAKNYIAISPYKLGSTTIDRELANERLITLVICAVTFIIAFVLQCILLRAMFASLHEYYRLMSNTGLTSRIAYISHILMLCVTALLGEAIGAMSIFALNSAGISRIADIFKYLDIKIIIILFILHFISVLLSLAGILFNLRKNVFGTGKSSYDIDFTLMEDSDV